MRLNWKPGTYGRPESLPPQRHRMIGEAACTPPTLTFYTIVHLGSSDLRNIVVGLYPPGCSRCIRSRRAATQQEPRSMLMLPIHLATALVPTSPMAIHHHRIARSVVMQVRSPLCSLSILFMFTSCSRPPQASPTSPSRLDANGDGIITKSELDEASPAAIALETDLYKEMSRQTRRDVFDYTKWEVCERVAPVGHRLRAEICIGGAARRPRARARGRRE